MTLILLMALASLAITVLFCGKKKEIVKETKEVKKPEVRTIPATQYCDCGLPNPGNAHDCPPVSTTSQREKMKEFSEYMNQELDKWKKDQEKKKNEQENMKGEQEKKKDEAADMPMPESDALALVAAIKKGLVRPQKDDESIDDHKTDWG
ncbi:hypothetical protein PFISCL1PPCAC_9523, partial [Pristionchus fissidentatus]